MYVRINAISELFVDAKYYTNILLKLDLRRSGLNKPIAGWFAVILLPLALKVILVINPLVRGLILKHVNRMKMAYINI